MPRREQLDEPKKVTVVRDKLGGGLWRGWTGMREQLGDYCFPDQQAGAIYHPIAQQVCAHAVCRLNLMDEQRQMILFYTQR